MKKELSIPFWVSIGLVITGALLLIWGAWVPPKGVIDGSLLEAFGLILLAVGILLGFETAQMAIANGTTADVTVGDKVKLHIDGDGDDKQ